MRIPFSQARDLLMPCLLLAAWSGLARPSIACTAIFAADGRLVLAGNNEDFWNCDTKIWFAPASKGRYGCLFLGHDLTYAQGGMNEAGLFFDGFATARNPLTRSLDKPIFQGNLIEKAMRECASVEEVVALFRRYNRCFLERAMLMFADRGGNSVIIEGDEFLHKKGRFQVVTNFYQSLQTGEQARCRRFQTATRMLSENPEISLELVRRILDAVHAEGSAPTQYSNICDLKRGVMHLYHFHDFEHPVVINLRDELEKGAHAYDIPALFPANEAFEAFRLKRRRAVQSEIERRWSRDLDPGELDAYTGTYRVTSSAHSGALLRVMRRGDVLLLSSPGAEKQRILPEGRDRFFCIGRYGSVDFQFKRDATGKVKSLVRRHLGGRIEAQRCARVPRRRRL